jgi:hypothetical protein
MMADREGRLEDRPKRIKGELFPYDSIDVEPLLAELEQWGFIERYTADGKKVIAVVSFIDHQAPHGTEKDSDLPDKNGFYTVNERNPKNGLVTGNKRNTGNNDAITVNPPLFNDAITVNPPFDNALNPDSLNPDSLNQKQTLSSSQANIDDEAVQTELGRVIETKQPSGKARKPTTQVTEVFDFWRETLGHERAQLDPTRHKKIADTLKAGYSVDDLKAAILGCSLTPHNMGINDRNERYDGLHIIFKPDNVDRFISRGTSKNVVNINTRQPEEPRRRCV